jgi:hypothetical protein
LLKLLLVFAKIVIITLVFEKNANFLAENCDHNIDLRCQFMGNVRCDGHLENEAGLISPRASLKQRIEILAKRENS